MLFASAAALPALLDGRERTWVRRFGEGPVSARTNPPAGGGALAGLHVLAVADAPVRPLLDGVQAAGRVVQAGRERWICLQDLVGRDPAGRLGPADEQPARMFERAERLLTAQGSHVREVVRVWIQADRLVPAYGGLNAARDALFVRAGIRSGRRLTRPPASSAVQGSHPRGAACSLDLIAVGGVLPVAIAPIDQPAAWSYGAAFSRGLVVADTVFLSGTGSVAPDGSTAHPGDPRAQILRAWAEAAGRLRSVDVDPARAGWTVTLAGEEVYAAWAALVAEGELPALDAVLVLGGSSRDDLLVTLEATA